MILIKNMTVEGQLVSVDEVKNYLKINTDEDDTLIAKLISAAYIQFESFTGISPVVTVYECTGYSYRNSERVPRVPVVDISSQDGVRLLTTDILEVPICREYSFTLRAGYATTPDSIVEVILRAIAEMYTKRDNTVNLSMFKPFRRVYV